MTQNNLYSDGSTAQLQLLNQQIGELKQTIAQQNELIRTQSETIENLENGGCDYAQGYLFAKPLPPEQAGKFIQSHFKAK